ncbi:MAG: nuclear transport factor 2 family protein [Pseudomonadota bacterium]
MTDEFKGFSQRWKDFPDYILGITHEIWESRGVGTLHHYYAEDIPVRSPMGIQRGNKAVIASTMATINEFPDRELFGEDVIWCGNEEDGYLSSHRLHTTGTHLNDGQFGPASGKRFRIRAIADCAARENTIFDELLIRDYGGMVRQFGMDPKDFARDMIAAEGGPDNCNRPFTPDQDVDGGYNSRGNANEWGEKYADILSRIMGADLDLVAKEYDRAVVGEYAGAKTVLSTPGVDGFWIGLRSSFPSAAFEIHHQIGMDADMLSPRASVRWSLTGKHDGWGAFGAPTGANVHVMGMCHAEFGPWGLRREFALYDEVAIWKQILMQSGNA